MFWTFFVLFLIFFQHSLVENLLLDVAEFVPSNDSTKSQRCLVCNDMKGGYLDDDAALHGSTNSNAFTASDAWRYCDTFVYFSHAFVSVPPPAWIDVAHRHSTKVLATLLTEWGPGEELCLKLLASTGACGGCSVIGLTLFSATDGPRICFCVC